MDGSRAPKAQWPASNDAFGVERRHAIFLDMVAGPSPADLIAGAHPVVICCAPEDRADLETVVPQLEAKGCRVEIVSDAASDPKSLEPIILRHRGNGVYVLCRTEGLTREGVDRLREILLAHRVPFGRTLTVASTRATELVHRITGALRRASGAATRPTGAVRPTMVGMPPPAGHPTIQRGASFASERESLPTQVGMRNEDTVADAAPTSEDTIATQAPPLASDEGTTQESGRAWLDERYDHRKNAGSFEGGPTSRMRQAPTSEDSLANAPLITAEDLADLAADDEDEAPRIQTSAMPSRTSATKALITGDTVIARLVGGHAPTNVGPSGLQQSDTSRGEPFDAPHLEEEELVAADAYEHPALTFLRNLPKPAWFGAGAVVLVFGFLGWALSGDGENDASETAQRTEERSDDKSEPTPLPEDDASDDESAPDASLPGQNETPVMAALRNRELRALDVLLVAKEDGPLLEWTDAETYCRIFDAAGLMDWRLPEVGELASMTEAGMIGNAIYWSKTPADTFGDTHLAWNGRLKRVLQREGTSRVICVRGEHGTL